jgi:hypothetical protein
MSDGCFFSETSELLNCYEQHDGLLDETLAFMLSRTDVDFVGRIDPILDVGLTFKFFLEYAG